MKRILVGYIQDGKHSGIDKYLLGFVKVAHENGVMLDFLTDKATQEISEYLQGLGYGLFEVPSLKKPLSQYRTLKSIMQNGSYDAVYLNISEAFNCMGLIAAKKLGISERIIHSHSSGTDRENKYSRAVRTALNIAARPFVSRASTRRLACSEVAGKWMFDKGFEIIYNAVDKQRFAFDADARKSVRKELGLDGKKVFIHIGHFNYAKNHAFLLDVMSELVKADKTAVLLSVGVGDGFDGTVHYAEQLGVRDNILFLGVRNDIPQLLSASDVFLLPSRLEGMPVVSVEAQFSGLPCILSDAVTHEAKLTDRTVFLKTDSASNWASVALSSVSERRAAEISKSVLENYDIENQKKQLVDIMKGHRNGKALFENTQV